MEKNTKQTILIVDDTEINIDILDGLLGDTYDIFIALDGKSALEIANKENLDLILLDIVMPNLNGYQVCEILKEDKHTKDIPIIFITSSTDEDSIEKAYDIGGIDYITKPFKPKELFARISTQLKIVKLMTDYKNSQIQLQEFNKVLKSKVRLEVKKNQKSQERLFKSERMAAMGEMIGNIAHQWRQPLSVISINATGLSLHNEMGLLDDEKLNTACDAINVNAQYLSRTIDDFRNFIKGDSIKTNFNLGKNINSFLHLVDASIKSNNITVVLHLDANIELSSYPNELNQCFMNIFNNAKDALIENIKTERFIFITTFKKDNYVYIKIKDNANGISQDILPKIFEPYFTTKHQSQGTGLGLHMSHKIITDVIKGSLEVKNKQYMWNNQSMKGAEFCIRFI